MKSSNKRKLIFAAIVVALIIAVLLFAHYAPVWVSVTNIVTFFAGAIVGWFARLIYVKYFAHEKVEGNE